MNKTTFFLLHKYVSFFYHLSSDEGSFDFSFNPPDFEAFFFSTKSKWKREKENVKNIFAVYNEIP